MTRPLVFISYSRKDTAEKEHLLTHLKVLQNAGHIETWSDAQIAAGADWERDIDTAIQQAQVAILLITASFLTSDFVLRTEVPAFLERQQQHGLIIYPILAKACAWKSVPWLARMSTRPFSGRPVWSDGGSHVDEDLALVAEEITEMLRRAAPAVVASLPMVRFSLVVPTGERYETEASPDTLITELQTAFLQEWQPTLEVGAVSYALRHTPHSRDLEPTATLAEVGITAGATLYLHQQRLGPAAPVRLTIEDAQGHYYITAVRLDTSVGMLAQAFLDTLEDAGDSMVEVLTGTLAQPQRRWLRRDATLYEEQIRDGAHLRIVPAVSSTPHVL